MHLKDTSLLSCWPDGFSRYYSVSNILQIVFGNRHIINILDVGGDSEWMAKFLVSANISFDLSIVDTRVPDFKMEIPNVHYVQADFFKIPLDDFSPDVVINTDVLEHIPLNLKTPFVNRCIELAKSLVIISAPQDDEEVTLAEHKIDEYYRTTRGTQQPWLKEHFKYGKPNASSVASVIEEHKLPYVVIDTNNIENWFLSFALNFTNSEVAGIEGMDEFNRYYNENIHKVGDFSGKPYRKIFVIFKDLALYNACKDRISDSFAPDATQKIPLILKATSLYVDTVKRLARERHDAQQECASLSKKLEKVDGKLTATQNELEKVDGKLTATQNELQNIKEHPVRYAASRVAERLQHRLK